MLWYSRIQRRSYFATWSRSWCASATDLGGKLTSGALGLTESFMMLPGASVCGLVFSHPEAQFPCDVQSRSWCASATDLREKSTRGALGLTLSFMMLPGA